MQPVHYYVSQDPGAAAGCQWVVARHKRICLVCPDRLEAVAFAVSLARDDHADRRIALVHVRERDSVRTVWTSANAPPA